MTSMTLLKPSLTALPGYAEALRRGWSPDNLRPEAAQEHLEKIARDAITFVAGLDDPEAKSGPIRLADGSLVQRIPGFHRWMWDGEFCGMIGLRWQHGTAALPEHVHGHIGYTVVPWKRRRGYATQALAALLPEARRQGLDYVELSVDPENLASQRVIARCGGQLVGRYRKPAAYGGEERLRFHIHLAGSV